jgi:hypothetical protein
VRKAIIETMSVVVQEIIPKEKELSPFSISW